MLTIVRYLQARTQRAFLESAALCALAFFMLATRMHERYIYDGLAFSIVCAAVRAALSVARGRLLVYAVRESVLLAAVSGRGVRIRRRASTPTQIMWPLVTHPLSFAERRGVLRPRLRVLGTESQDEARTAAPARTAPAFRRGCDAGADWFDPREGLARWRGRSTTCWRAALASSRSSFPIVNYWLPTEKIFDEIYFARAAEEYLQGPVHLREHASAAHETDHHALDDALRRPARTATTRTAGAFWTSCSARSHRR